MPQYALNTSLPSYLRDEQKRIEGYARSYGLDFFPTLFEVLSYDHINEVAAYGGFPSRYPHWRFGMQYEQLSKSSEYGLSTIYEMVINNNPAVAYLLEGNSLTDQKLVMAHVFGHVDFFKNNFAFGATNQGRLPDTGEPIRKWIDAMANHGAVIRRWINRVGIEKIETFIDDCLSLENLIDPHRPFTRPAPPEEPSSEVYDKPGEELPRLRVDRDYMESYINPDEFLEAQRKRVEAEAERAKSVPEEPDRDVMGFLLEQAPLEPWERDVLAVIRREAYYFAPQAQTKIMNEGWATYWHSKILTEHAASGDEIIEYADRCAGVLATAPGQLNPYKLGVELFRHVEDRWNKGQFGKEWDDCDDLALRQTWDRRLGLGRDKIFEVRRHYTDVTFIDEFLTPEFVIDQKLYSFGFNVKNDRWEVESRQFEEVKKKLLFQLTNAGNPIVNVVDANHHNRAELLLRHDHQGVDLRRDYAEAVMRSLERIWRRPVEVDTIVEEKRSFLRFDGNEHTVRTD
ncbi:MAG: SpoVR family protein [Myxococcales bacterium]|nr:SpoVR family protein [Myxococcales bacterium]MDD9966635.1 SpoVR family protein [Myxococcales bacterium]